MKLISDLGGGILLLQMPVFRDNRGQFIKLDDQRLQLIRAYEQRQLNYVTSEKKFTFRGLHYQKDSFSESKIFHLISGSVLVIGFDVRRGSNTFKKTFSVRIDRTDIAVWTPRGIATGYCTLEENSSVLYSSDNDYNPGAECGIRWNDPLLLLEDFPTRSPFVSDKDMMWPDFQL